MGLNQMKNKQKKNLTKWKKHSTKWKGNLWYESKYLQTIYKALISKICQQHMQLNSKNKQTNLIRICAEQTFPKMISIDNMYMKRWLISLIISTTMWHHFTSDKAAISKKMRDHEWRWVWWRKWSTWAPLVEL